MIRFLKIAFKENHLFPRQKLMYIDLVLHSDDSANMTAIQFKYNAKQLFCTDDNFKYLLLNKIN